MRILMVFFFTAATLCLFLKASSPFVVTQSEAVVVSRNEVKEEIGGLLHAVADNAGALLSVVGKTMMQLGVLQRVTAEQASLLLEDSAPFNTASTARLSAAQTELSGQVAQLQDLLAKVDELAGRIAKTVRLEK